MIHKKLSAFFVVFVLFAIPVAADTFTGYFVGDYAPDHWASGGWGDASLSFSGDPLQATMSIRTYYTPPYHDFFGAEMWMQMTVPSGGDGLAQFYWVYHGAGTAFACFGSFCEEFWPGTGFFSAPVTAGDVLTIGIACWSPWCRDSTTSSIAILGSPVAEPSSLILLGTGILSLGTAVRRRLRG